MRIAFVVHDFNRAFGHGRYVAELAGRYAASHDVHVFANTFAHEQAGIHHHRVPALRLSALTTILSFYPSATLRMPRSFDIVHAQGFSVSGANVVTAHISQRRWMEARQALCHGQLPWRERLFGTVVTPLERRALASPDVTAIAVSDALRRDLIADGSSARIVVIPHGVDTDVFSPWVVQRYRSEMRREVGLADDRDTLFLFVGDLRKGCAHVVQALATTPGRLVAVSRSEPGDLLSLARRLGVADRVQVRPATHSVERYYAAADVFVFPTPYDAFGMVITEAMACGLPVITTTTAGAAELVAHGRSGFLLNDPSDVTALARWMRALASDPAARVAVGHAARETMRLQSWDSVASQTMAVYEQVAARCTPVAA